ncbi:MAG: cupin domain-containing protein [Sulfobacillus benefaciens]|uniref:Cupin domain-containing protein n=1 Tax=Sulfobacillus benefaciens TaxID=453960 RepID=A0A2T2XIX6_9FIRM|nr:MAG: cupin domain-containing protein [Sulfobacillus benefaciens]
MPMSQGFEAAPGVVLRPFFGQRLMASYVTFAPGADAPIHQHSQEQLTLVISGRLRFTVGENTSWMESGDIVSIPPNVPHKATAGDQGCVAIDMFSPIRDGFRELMATQNVDTP